MFTSPLTPSLQILDSPQEYAYVAGTWAVKIPPVKVKLPFVPPEVNFAVAMVTLNPAPLTVTFPVPAAGVKEIPAPAIILFTYFW